jgi:AAA15 family ATPase/GTPase
MVSLIKNSDVGIFDISKSTISFDELIKDDSDLKELPEFILEKIKEDGMSTIKTEHIQYNKDDTFYKMKTFDLSFESDGTQKLLALAAPILDTLESGNVLIIDELDNSLHTELVEAIIKLFNSSETNPNNAQLIFTTHDTNLLNQDLFRRDQIWFAQKSVLGQSELYSLVEYGKGKTRDDLVLEKNYLDGKFGATPHISSLAHEANDV